VKRLVPCGAQALISGKGGVGLKSTGRGDPFFSKERKPGGSRAGKAVKGGARQGHRTPHLLAWGGRFPGSDVRLGNRSETIGFPQKGDTGTGCVFGSWLGVRDKNGWTHTTDQGTTPHPEKTEERENTDPTPFAAGAPSGRGEKLNFSF